MRTPAIPAPPPSEPYWELVRMLPCAGKPSSAAGSAHLSCLRNAWLAMAYCSLLLSSWRGNDSHQLCLTTDVKASQTSKAGAQGDQEMCPLPAGVNTCLETEGTEHAMLPSVPSPEVEGRAGQPCLLPPLNQGICQQDPPAGAQVYGHTGVGGPVPPLLASALCLLVESLSIILP